MKLGPPAGSTIRTSSPSSTWGTTRAHPTSSRSARPRVDAARPHAPSREANGSARQLYSKGQPYHNHDLSLAKSFPLGKGSRLQLRIAAYNVFNHPIRYPDVSRNLTLIFDNGVQANPDFGKLPEDNKYGRRIVQLSARFEF